MRYYTVVDKGNKVLWSGKWKEKHMKSWKKIMRYYVTISWENNYDICGPYLAFDSLDALDVFARDLGYMSYAGVEHILPRSKLTITRVFQGAS